MNTYLWYSLKLCVLPSTKFSAWYNQHFIQLYIYEREKCKWKLDYEDREIRESVFLEVLELYAYKKKDLDYYNIVNIINENLYNKYYVIIEIDEYYFPEKSHFRKRHFIHPILIYGSDNINNFFFCIGFDKRNIFRTLQISYNDLVKATNSCLSLIDNKSLILSIFRPKVDINFYNPIIVKKNLESYINGNNINVCNSIFTTTPNYGSNTYSKVIECLKENIFDYRIFHLYAEHKKELLKKINYLNQYIIKDTYLNQYLLKFKEEVVDYSEKTRLKTLKYTIKNGLENNYLSFLPGYTGVNIMLDKNYNQDFLNVLINDLIYIKSKEDYYLDKIST
ncbi:hypothetical protein, partial [Clostridium sp. E02]|uniref:hypothetical protein n=1 Tax=Clostridium sp. E02 TaxID=2487134 RepID=UPI0019D0BE7B